MRRRNLVRPHILPRVPRVKLADVARAAGVHPGTASRALNPDTRDQVSDGTVRRVVRAAERLGYIPNAQARALRTARSQMVGFVVPDITNPLFPPIVRGAEHVLTAAGYTVVLTDTDNDRDRERRQVESLLARGVDGFIICTALWVDELVQELASSGVRAVLTNRRTSSAPWPFVGGDDASGIKLAVEHLVGLGHTRIVHLAGPENVSTSRERKRSFRAAARSLGLARDQVSVMTCAAYSEEQGRAAMRRVLAEDGRRLTAVVAGNDLIALGALDALDEAGLRCPADVSVVGFNDMPFADHFHPPLTTVHVPLEHMGAVAAQLLTRALEPETTTTPESAQLLDVELVVRGSTARPPSSRRRRS